MLRAIGTRREDAHVTTKLLEIRDRMTRCLALATRLDATNLRQLSLLKDAGYGTEPGSYVVLVSIRGGVSEAHDDPFEWASARTWRTAHQELIDHWGRYEDGDVLDVRVVLGESAIPVASEVG